MKKLIYNLILCTAIISFTSCSNSDDGGSEMEQEPEKGHVSLRINGDGFSDQKAELFREGIQDLGDGRVRILARSTSGYRITITLSAPIEKLQYSIADYNINNSGVSSVTVPGSGIYLSKAGGRVTISDIVESGDCTTYKGSLSITYRRQDNSPGEISVQGSFEMPTEACD